MVAFTLLMGVSFTSCLNDEDDDIFLHGLDAPVTQTINALKYAAARKMDDVLLSGFDNARTAMQAAGVNTSTFEDENAMLDQLVSRSQSAVGRQQAIQAGNEIAAQNVQQLQKLRDLVATQITLQGNYMAQQNERQSVSDASEQQFRSRENTRGPSEGF